MIPKIIHYCWFGGGEIPYDCQQYILEWRELHPDWEIIKWDETNLPLDEPYLKTAIKEKHWANMSNFLRLHALKLYGGVYLDIDIKLIKPLESFCNDRCFLGFEEGDELSHIFWVNNAICGSEKGHPFILECYEQLLKLYDGTEMANLSGPKLTTEVLKSCRGLNKYGYQQLDDVIVYPKEFFYPIHYSEVYKLANFQDYIFAETVAVHVWARTWLNRNSLLYIIDDLYKLNNQYLQQINEQSSIMEILKREQNASISGVHPSDLTQQKLLTKMQRIADGQYISKTLMEEFQHSIHKLNSQLEKRIEQIESLNNLYQKSVASNTHLSASFAAAQDHIAILKTEIEQQKNNYNHIRSDYDNSVKLIKDQQMTLTAYSQLIHEEKEEVRTLKEALGRKSEEINRLAKAIEQAEEKRMKSEKLCEDHFALINELKIKNTNLIAELSELASLGQLKDKENGRLNENILSLLQSDHTKGKKIDELRKDLHNVKAGESFFKERVNKQEIEIDKLRKQIRSLSGHQDMLKVSHGKSVERLENEILVLRDSISWYKDTYENRKLAGIIKDRVKNRFKIGAGTANLEKNTNSGNKAELPLKENGSEKLFFKDAARPDKSVKKLEVAGQANKIFCAIVNHNHNENAKKLKSYFSNHYETIVFDSGSLVKDADFVNLPNVYYSGLYNHAYEWAANNGFDYLLFICSDVIIEEADVIKMATNIASVDLTSIGVYSPSSHGRSHYQCKKKNQQGLRIVDFVEGFMFLANIKILKQFSPIATDKNLFGWGIDVVKGYCAKKMNLLCVIDDEVIIHHPEETGYSSDAAEIQMYEWFESLPDGERIKQFHTDRVERIRKGVEEKMKISIIIPCYNQASYLEEAVFSIFNQTYSDFEVLIINDGSTDDTEIIAQNLSHRYNQVKYIYQENKGLGATRNTGLINSTGDLIQFLDADDLLDKEKFNNAVNIFTRNHSVDIVYSAYICFEDGKPENTWTYSRVEMENDPVADLINEWEKELSIPVHCFMFRKEIIGNILFDVALPNHEDWAFHLNIAAKSPVYYHDNKSTAFYRIKQTAMSQDRTKMINGKNMCIANVINSRTFSGDYVKKMFLRFDYSLVIGIVTCKKNKDKIDQIRNTWAKDLEAYGIRYFFIVGDPSSDVVYAKDDMLYVNCPDNYESLPKKVLLFYEYINKNTSYDYVYKIDDDCYVNVENLFSTYFWNYDYFGKIVATQEEDLNRAWHFGKCENYSLNSTPYSVPYYGEWCGGGFGYFLSKKAIEALEAWKEQISNELYEDKAIGDALRQSGILPAENPNYRVLDVQQFKIDHSSKKEITDLISHVGEDVFIYQTIIELNNRFYYSQINQTRQQYVTY